MRRHRKSAAEGMVIVLVLVPRPQSPPPHFRGRGGGTRTRTKFARSLRTVWTLAAEERALDCLRVWEEAGGPFCPAEPNGSDRNDFRLTNDYEMDDTKILVQRTGRVDVPRTANGSSRSSKIPEHQGARNSGSGQDLKKSQHRPRPILGGHSGGCREWSGAG